MKKKHKPGVILWGLLAIMLPGRILAQEVLSLDKQWTIVPSGKWDHDGKQLSTEGFDQANSLTSDLPSTVFAALVNNGRYADPYYADNLTRVPTAWFNTAWKYSRTFDVEASKLSDFSQLIFEGINYSADIFLNGRKIASADTLKGAFRRFTVDITGHLLEKKNLLEVCVYPPQKGDFTIGFVDWNPEPPDKNMGIWRGIKLRFHGPVSIENPVVKTKIKGQSEADITIETTAENHGKATIKTKIFANLDHIRVSKEISLLPGEKKKIIWEPGENPGLLIKQARLWWPVNLGDPNLYKLEVTAEINRKISDKTGCMVGLREVSDYINPQGSRVYQINGKDVQIRGGGWADELLLREDEKNLEAQVQYTRLMNLNCIRLEGFWGSSQKLYELCDKYGILVMVGWSCQWEWEDYVGKKCDDFGSIETPEEIDLVAKSLEDQVLWLRNHPSIFVWVLGSDKLPRPALEKRYRADFVESDNTRPLLMSCKMLTSEISGPTAVKMNGPYDYVTPNYWYLDKKNGGAFGFNTETGPGPQIPSIESLEKMFPKEKIWPINELWDFHCGRHEFNTLKRYKQAMDNRYGEPVSLEDFLVKAELANYEAIRPMFESFAIHKAEAGGVVQWMLNASWPKLFWQLYDYYLTPGSAFFGTQQALKPLNILYHYGDKGIYISNDHPNSYDHIIAKIRVLNTQSQEIFTQEVPCTIPQFTSQKITTLEKPENLPSVYFVDLRIINQDHQELSSNFYWLSAKEDKPDFEKTEWFVTPTKEYADFIDLKKLGEARVEMDTKIVKSQNQTNVNIHLKNSSQNLAFFLGMKVKGSKTGAMILPAYWNENYISLLPGEERDLTVKVNNTDLKDEQPVIVLKGYNTKEIKL